MKLFAITCAFFAILSIASAAFQVLLPEQQDQFGEIDEPYVFVRLSRSANGRQVFARSYAGYPAGFGNPYGGAQSQANVQSQALGFGSLGGSGASAGGASASGYGSIASTSFTNSQSQALGGPGHSGTLSHSTGFTQSFG